MDTVRYHTWSKYDSNRLFESLRDIMRINEPQFYFPIMSLFFYIHNTKNSHKRIDFKRDHYIKQIHSTKQIKEYNSNCFVDADIDSNGSIQTTQLFCKILPLLDPMHFLLNNYNLSIHRNPLLPSNYSFNTSTKINDMNNMAYIDIFFSYIASHITLKHKNPSFPIYYGSTNGVGEYKHDITDDIDEFQNHDGFKQLYKKQFTVEEYYNSDSSDEDSYSDNSSYNSSEDDDDTVITFNKFPVAQLFIEKLDGTLEDIIKYNLSLQLLKSCLFQVTFALIYLQKHYKFTHNDLHINNVMYTHTEKPYLYYKYNNQYFKVPTFGFLFKIIDFGRSIFTFRKKTYMNDVFSKYGEAEGQYTHPPQVSFLESDYSNMVYPSYYFDICRLAITMIDEIRYNHDDELEDNDDYQDFLDFLKYLVTDKQGTRLDKVDDNFDLYIKISRDAKNSLPREVLLNKFFIEYRVKKKKFPKSMYYTV